MIVKGVEGKSGLPGPDPDLTFPNPFDITRRIRIFWPGFRGWDTWKIVFSPDTCVLRKILSSEYRVDACGKSFRMP